jgi:hypothetical protein
LCCRVSRPLDFPNFDYVVETSKDEGEGVLSVKPLASIPLANTLAWQPTVVDRVVSRKRKQHNQERGVTLTSGWNAPNKETKCPVKVHEKKKVGKATSSTATNSPSHSSAGVDHLPSDLVGDTTKSPFVMEISSMSKGILIPDDALE